MFGLAAIKVEDIQKEETRSAGQTISSGRAPQDLRRQHQAPRRRPDILVLQDSHQAAAQAVRSNIQSYRRRQKQIGELLKNLNISLIFIALLILHFLQSHVY